MSLRAIQRRLDLLSERVERQAAHAARYPTPQFTEPERLLRMAEVVFGLSECGKVSSRMLAAFCGALLGFSDAADALREILADPTGEFRDETPKEWSDAIPRVWSIIQDHKVGGGEEE